MKYRTPFIVAALLALAVTGYANQPTAPDVPGKRIGIKFPSDDFSTSPDARWKLLFKTAETDDGEKY
ncbi:MAG: hypothetical protein DVB25_07955 [Verrucomicrobia bacterium]|nr:MAG: hypothetical protein DVB25_07955 [Verrucomicrobiota bacterium]